jgi:hypothetical protein
MRTDDLTGAVRRADDRDRAFGRPEHIRSDLP